MGSWVLSSCNPRFLCPIYMEMYGESQGKIFNQISGKRGKSSRLETRKHRRIHLCLNYHFRNNQSERYMNLCNSVPFWTPVADIRHQHLTFIQYCPILDTKARFQTLVFDFRHQCPILDTCVRLQLPDPKLETSTLLETTVSQQMNDRNQAGDHKFSWRILPLL